jgi:hypothetical protein
MKKPMCAGNTVEQNRTADFHNLSERPQRDRIDEKMKSLQLFIPNSSKTDKAPMLDEAMNATRSIWKQYMTALDMGVRMGVVDMDATLSDQWHSPHFIKPNLMYPRNSYLAHQETMQIQQRCNVEQLGMVHQSSSEGNMEVKNYGVNEYGDHYLSGLREA